MEKSSETKFCGGNVLALVHKMEPLAMKEATYIRPQENKIYSFKTPKDQLPQVWAEDLEFCKSDPTNDNYATPSEKKPEIQTGTTSQKETNDAINARQSSSKKSLWSSSSSASSTSAHKSRLSLANSESSDYDHIYNYPETNITKRGDSRRKLPGVPDVGSPSKFRFFKTAPFIVVIMIIVMLSIAAGGIVGTIIAFKSCTESFTKYKDKFVIGGVLRSAVTSPENCSRACLENPSCGGYDYDRLSNKCYLITGAVEANLLEAAKTTDHYERHGVCNKSQTAPHLCTMFHSLDGQAPGGVPVGVMSLEACFERCQLETGCLAVDHNKHTGQCYVHIKSPYPIVNECCVHYSKACNRCKYSIEEDQYSAAAIRVNHINQLSDCGVLCNQKSVCAGFDFERGARVCSIVYLKGYKTDLLHNVINFRKGSCNPIKGPSL